MRVRAMTLAAKKPSSLSTTPITKRSSAFTAWLRASSCMPTRRRFFVCGSVQQDVPGFRLARIATHVCMQVQGPGGQLFASAARRCLLALKYCFYAHENHLQEEPAIPLLSKGKEENSHRATVPLQNQAGQAINRFRGSSCRSRTGTGRRLSPSGHTLPRSGRRR